MLRINLDESKKDPGRGHCPAGVRCSLVGRPPYRRERETDSRFACLGDQLGMEVITMTTRKGTKPGKPAPDSGQYRPSSGGSEITAVEGKPMPPTPRPGQTWKLVDKTKHKR